MVQSECRQENTEKITKGSDLVMHAYSKVENHIIFPIFRESITHTMNAFQLFHWYFPKFIPIKLIDYNNPVISIHIELCICLYVDGGRGVGGLYTCQRLFLVKTLPPLLWNTYEYCHMTSINCAQKSVEDTNKL